jgi:hypothetical protein
VGGVHDWRREGGARVRAALALPRSAFARTFNLFARSRRPARPSPPAAAASAGRVVDPASFLRISLDASLKHFTPAHWAYELVNAVLAGDGTFVALTCASHAKAWDPALIMEPLGPSGQNLLHVAALMNRPDVVRSLLESWDTAARRAADAQALSVRYESVATKTTEDSHARAVALAKELDKTERVSGARAERVVRRIPPPTPTPHPSPL